MTRCLTFFAGLLTSLAISGQPSVRMDIRHLPVPVSIGGKPVIYYELWLTCASATPVTLHKLEVIDAVDSSILETFSAQNLARRYSLPPAPAQNPVLLPGAAGMLYLETVLPTTRVNPRLAHRLTVADADHKMMTVRSDMVSLPEQTPPVLGQPLRGGPWVAVYEPGWKRGHRRVTYTVNDTTRIPGRFAIDFMLLNKQAKLSHHQADSIVNWYGYAADVLAVADGVVAAMRNDFPESPTLSAHPKCPPEQAAGNYIALDIGGGRYVFYEHLKTASIAVRPGQRVKKGERLAALGFTGQTTGPHLHLHVADRRSTLGAEGLPFALERFQLLGSYPGADGLGEKQWIPARFQQPVIVGQRPQPNAVIVFPK